MTNPRDDHRAAELLDVTENASFNSARRHVGAAGFVQRDVLEQIISAGKEQIGVTRSLRQVIDVTQAQLRDLAGGGSSPEAQLHIATLQGIIASSQEQKKTATDLREAIQRTLENVRGTPLEDVSGTLLHTLSAVVQRQMEQLQDLITTALQEADTAGQVAQLQQVSTEAHARQIQTEHEQAERDLAQLEVLGSEALDRVRELEESGRTHAVQRADLEQKADSTRSLISALEREEGENLAQLTRLEQERVVSAEVQHALEVQVVESKARLETTPLHESQE